MDNMLLRLSVDDLRHAFFFFFVDADDNGTMFTTKLAIHGGAGVDPNLPEHRQAEAQHLLVAWRARCLAGNSVYVHGQRVGQRGSVASGCPAWAQGTASGRPRRPRRHGMGRAREDVAEGCTAR